MGVVAADQLTKWWAVRALSDGPMSFGAVRLVLSHNRGAAFGLGSGVVPLVVLAAISLVVALVVLGRSTGSTAMSVATGLLLGGAVGNLADRVARAPGLFRGAVVDFVDLRWWPVFNLADSAITVGAVMLVLLSRSPRPSRR